MLIYINFIYEIINNKIKHKNVIENIFKDKNDDLSNNKKYKINIISNNGEKINNNIITEINKEYKEIKERDSINSNNKQKNSSKYNLTINIDGGFTNISLACITQNKTKEKNNSKIKNSKNVKKSNILKIKELSGKNIDIIILIGTKLTKNKIISKLKNIFINSKIIYSNCDNYIVIGATMQALNNNMIKPFYKFINITNMNFGIETLNGLMDVIISKGLKIPVQNIKYVKIKNNENNETENNHLNKYLEINIFEGDNKFVKNNRLISCANIDKRNFKEEKVGQGFIELLVEF